MERKAQAAIRKIGHYERDNRLFAPLTIRCGVCGRAMSRNPRGKEVAYY